MCYFISLLIGFYSLLIPVNASAFDNEQQVAQVYEALLADFDAVLDNDQKIRPKAAGTLLLEAYLLNDTGTSKYVSQTYPALSISEVRVLGKALYEIPGYSVFSYQGAKVQVWYTGETVKQINVMAYVSGNANTTNTNNNCCKK